MNSSPTEKVACTIAGVQEAKTEILVRTAQRRYAPMVFGFIPEQCSDSLRNMRSASPESSSKACTTSRWPTCDANINAVLPLAAVARLLPQLDAQITTDSVCRAR